MVANPIDWSWLKENRDLAKTDKLFYFTFIQQCFTSSYTIVILWAWDLRCAMLHQYKGLCLCRWFRCYLSILINVFFLLFDFYFLSCLTDSCFQSTKLSPALISMLFFLTIMTIYVSSSWLFNLFSLWLFSCFLYWWFGLFQVIKLSKFHMNVYIDEMQLSQNWLIENIWKVNINLSHIFKRIFQFLLQVCVLFGLAKYHCTRLALV
jgi:hypothetical protein